MHLSFARASLVMSFVLLGCLSATTAMAQTTNTFTGAGGSSTLSSNWSGNNVPIAGNAWWINNATGGTINYNFDSATFPNYWTNGITFGPTNGATTIAGGASGTMTLGGNLINLSTAVDSITANIALTSSLNVITNGAGGNFSISGIISDGGGALGLNKYGAGTLTLTGQNTYTGATTVSAGVLALDFINAAAGTTATGIINSSSALQLRGGSVNIIGHASNATTQTFNGVTVGAGFSTISISGANVTVGLGALTHNAGGVLNLATVSGANTVTTSNTNLSTGILGGGYFVGLNDFATVTTAGNKVVALAAAGYTTQLDQSLWTSPSAIYQNSGTSALVGSLTGNTTIGGLRFFGNASTGLSLNGNILTINDGAGVGTILINSAVAAKVLTINSAIAGAGLTAGTGAGGELIILNNGGTTTGITVNVPIGDNGSGVVDVVYMGGPATTGAATFTGVNTYSGGTYILGGTLNISSNANLGAVATGATVTLNGGALGLNGTNFSLDNNGVNNRGIFLGANGGTIAPVTNTFTVSGVVSGVSVSGANQYGGGALTKAGSGILVLSNNANSYAGGTIISAGTLAITSDGALGAVPSNATPSITMSGTLRFLTTGTTLNANRSIFVNNAITATVDTLGNWSTIAGNITGGGTGNVAFTGTGTVNVLGSVTNLNALQVTTATVTLSQGASVGTVTMTSGTLNAAGTISSGTTILQLIGGTLNSLSTTAQTFGNTTFGGGTMLAAGNLTVGTITSSATTRAGTFGAVQGSTITTVLNGPVNGVSLNIVGNNTLSVSNAAAVWNATAITLGIGNGGKVIIDNTGAGNVATQRFNTANLLTFGGTGQGGGTLDFRANTSAGNGQTLSFGAMTIASGGSTLDFSSNASGTAATVSAASLAITTPTGAGAGGGVLNILYPTGGGPATQQVRFTAAPAGTLMGLITINGYDFATYSGTAITTASYSIESSGTLTASGSALPLVNGTVASAAVNLQMLKMQNGTISGSTAVSFTNTPPVGSVVGAILATSGSNVINAPITYQSLNSDSRSEFIVNVDTGSTLTMASLLQGGTLTNSFVVKAGAGTLTLGAALNTRAGFVFVDGGTLGFASLSGSVIVNGTATNTSGIFVGQGATLALNGNALTLDALVGGGTVNLGAPTAARTFGIGEINTAVNFTGNFTNGGTFSSLFKNGTANATFSGSLSAFGGGITITNGGLIYTGTGSGFNVGALTFGGGTTALGLTFSGLNGGTATATGLALNLTTNNFASINFTTTGSLKFTGALSLAGNGTLLVRGQDLGQTNGTLVNFGFNNVPAGTIVPYVLGDTNVNGVGRGYMIVDATTRNLRLLSAADYGGTNSTTATNPAFNQLYTTTTSITSNPASMNLLAIDAGANDSNAIAVTGPGGTLSITTGIIQVGGTGAGQTATLGGFSGIAPSGTTDFNIFVGISSLTISSPLVNPSSIATMTKVGTGSLILSAANPSLSGGIFLQQGGLQLQAANALNSSISVTLSGSTALTFNANNAVASVTGLGATTVSIGAGITVTIGALSGPTMTTNIGANSTVYLGAGSITTGSLLTTAVSSKVIRNTPGAFLIYGNANFNGGQLQIDAGSFGANTVSLGGVLNAAITVNPGGTFTFGSRTAGAIASTFAGNTITLNAGAFAFTSSQATLLTIDSLTLNRGQSTISLTNTSTTSPGTPAQVTATAFTRNNNSTVLFSGNFGLTNTATNFFASGLTGALNNGGFQVSPANGNQGILPWAMSDLGSGKYAFLTYDSAGVGVRAATASGEAITVDNTTTFIGSANGSSPYSNVVIASATSVPLTGNQTLNALNISNSTALAASLDLAGFTLTIDGGLLASSNAAARISGASGSQLTFGAGNNYVGNIFTGTALTISAPIVNAGVNPVTIVKSGASTLFLSGTNLYSGGTQINSGTLAIGAESALGLSTSNVTFSAGALQLQNNLTLSAGRVLSMSNPDSTSTAGASIVDTNGFYGTIDSQISGTGMFEKAGAGTLTLSNASNNYSGGTVLQGGTLYVPSLNVLGSGANLTFGGTGALQIASGITTITQSIILASGVGILDTNGASATLTGTISGSGNLVKAGAGTLRLGSASSFTGTLTIGAGVLRLENGSAAQFGAIGVNINNSLTFGSSIGTFTVGGLTGAGTVTLQDASANAISLVIGNTLSTYSGTLSGTGGITKALGGVQFLSGTNNSYTSGTTLTQGILIINGDGSLGAVPGSPQVNITFNGNTGVLQFALPTTLNANRLIAINTGSVGTIDTGGTRSTIAGTMSGGGTFNKAGFGTLVLAAGQAQTGGTSISGGSIGLLDNTSLGPAGSTVSFVGSPGYINTVGLYFAANGVTVDAGRTLSFASGLSVTFDTGSNTGTIAGLMAVDSTDALFKVGSGTLALGGANTFTAPVTVVEGSLLLANPLALQNSTLINVASGGTLAIASGGGTYAVNTISGNGTIALNDSFLTLGNNNSTSSFGGTIGGSGSITKVGSGTLTLSGTSSTYSGGTTIAGGTLAIAGNGTGFGSLGAAPGSPTTNISFSGNSALLFLASGTLSANRTITLNSGVTGTFDVGANVVTFLGGIGGSGTLNKVGAGYLVLGGSSSYSGGTTVTAGTLAIGSNNALGSGTVTVSGGNLLIGVANVTLANNFTFTGGQVASFDTTLAGSGATITGVINGTGGLSQGTGTLNLTNTNGYTGTTTISAGGVLALRFGSGANAVINGASPLYLSNGSLNLVGNGTNLQTFSGVTYGAGSNTITTSATAMTVTLGALVHQTGGTLNFAPGAGSTLTTSQANTARGILGGGVFFNGNDFASQSGGIIAATGYTTNNNASTWVANTVINNSAVFTTNSLTGAITIGGLKFAFAGASTVSLSATAANILTINDGTGVGGVIVSSAVGNFLSTINGVGGLTAPNELIIQQNNTANGLLISAPIGGTGTVVVKNGPGIATFSGTNTYTGGTYLNAGTLVITGATDVGLGASGAVTFSGNAALRNATTAFTSARTININAGAIATLDNGAAASNWTGIIQGAGTLAKGNTVAGALSLSGLNTYTGGTILNGGSLIIASDSTGSGAGTSGSLGQVPVSAATPNITFSATSELGWSAATVINANRSIFIASNLVTASFGGVGANVAATYAGVISGAGGIAKTGTGTLALTGLNSYQGTTLVNGNTLIISNESTTAGPGSSASLGQVPTTTTNNIILTAGTLTVLTGSNNITIHANRTITLGGAGTISGTTNANLTIGGNITGNNTGVLALTSTGNIAIAGTVDGVTALQLSGAGTFSLLQGMNTTSAAISVGTSSGTLLASTNLTFSSFIGVGNSTRNLTISGPFTTNITGALGGNTLTLSPTSLNIAGGGTLSLSALAAVFSNTGGASTLSLNNATAIIDNRTFEAARIAAGVTENLILAGGKLTFLSNGGAASSSLPFGALTVSAGASVLDFGASGNAATISATSLAARAIGSTINITYGGTLGSASNANVTITGVSPGFLGGVMFANGTNLATFDGINGVQALTSSQYMTISSGNVGGSAPGIYDVTGNASVSGTTSLSGLRINDGVTIASGGTLSFSGIGISSSMTSNAGTILAVGAASTISSTIALPGAAQDLVIRVDSGTLSVATISGAATNAIVKSGAGTLRLATDSSADFTGTYFLNAGSLRIAGNLTTTLTNLQGVPQAGVTPTLSLGVGANLTIGTFNGFINTTMSSNSLLTIGGIGPSAGTVTGSFNGAASGTSSLVKAGTGTITYLGAINMVNSASGSVVAGAGILAINSATNSAGVSNASIVANPNGTFAVFNLNGSTFTNDAVYLQGGTLSLTMNPTAAQNITLPTITADFSTSFVNLTQSSTTAATTLTTTINQSNLGFVVVNSGTTLGSGSVSGAVNLMLGSTPLLSGGLNNAYNPNPVNGNQAITPNIVYGNGGKHYFATYDPNNGLRAATASGETVTVVTSADFANINSSGPYSNVVLAPTGTISLSGNTVVNALNYSPAAIQTFSLALNGTPYTLTIASGLFIVNSPASTGTMSGGNLTFGNGNQTTFNGNTVNLGIIDTATAFQFLNSGTTIQDAGSVPVALVKTGNGTFFATYLVPNNNNLYSGGTIIEQGTVIAVSGSFALGTGGVTFWGNNPVLAIQGANLQVPYITSVAPNGIPNLSTTFTPGLITTRVTGGSLILGGAGELSTTFGGNIQEAAGLTLSMNINFSSPTTVLTLTGITNTFSGGLTLTGGILAVSADTSNVVTSIGTGGVTFSGGTLRVFNQTGSTFASNRAFNLNAAGGTIDVVGTTAVFNTSIVGSGSLTISGSSGGVAVFDTQAFTYTGLTTVTGGGTLRVTSNSSLLSTSSLTIGGNGSAIFDNPGQQLATVINNSAAGTGLSFSPSTGTITLTSLTGTGTSLFNSAANIGTFSGGSATITGVGTIATLSSATITFAGVTANTIGTLTGTGGITLGATGTSLTASRGSFSGSIGSTTTGSFTKGGTGSDTLTLTGALTYTGGTNVNAGTLAVQAIAGSNAITVASGANFRVLTTSANGLPATATLTNSGTTYFNGAQTLAGLLGGSAGMVDLSGGGGAALTLQSASFAGNIIGAGGSLVLNGGGSAVYTLSGTNNNYSGGTTVSSGTAFVTSGSGGTALGTGAVNVFSGAKLASDVLVTISGAVTLSSSASLYAGTSGTSVLNLTGGLTANSGSAIRFVMDGSSNVSRINFGSSTLNTTAGTVTISLSGSGLASGDYPLFMYGSPLGANVTASLALSGAPGNYSLYYGNAGEIDLRIASIGSTLTWSSLTATGAAVDGSGTWNLASTNFVQSDNSTHQPWPNTQNDTVIFGANSGGNANIVTLAQDTTVGSMVFNALAGQTPYTITGTNNLLLFSGITANENATIGAPIVLQQSQVWSITSSSSKTLAITGGVSAVNGTVALTLQGPGGGNTASFNLLGNQTYAGTTTISGGAVVSLSGSLASGTVFIKDAGSALAAAGALNTSVNMADNSTLTIAGNQTLGTLTGSGTVAIGSAFTLAISSGNFAGTLTDSGTLSASVGALTLSGVNTGFTGKTAISSTGVVVLGNALALQNSTVALGANNGLSFAGGIGGFTIGGLIGGSNLLLQDAASGAVTLHVGNNGSTGSFGGSISGTGSSFDKVGGGTLTLSGTNNYSGATTVSAGILALNASGSINNTSGVAVNGSAALDAFGSLNSSVTLTVSGTGTATFHANQTLGNLQGASPTAVVSVGTNTLTLSSGSYAGQINGVGGNLVIGGNTTLTNTVNVTNTTTISNGTLNLAGTLASATVSVGAGNGLNITNSADNALSAIPYLAVASIGGNIGTVSLAGNQTLGTLTGSGIVQIASGKTMTLQAGSYGGIIGGTGGSVLINSAGTVTLSSLASSYSGGTTINAGTLNIQGDLSLGAAPGVAGTNITFSGNSALQINAITTLAATRTITVNTGVTATIDTQANAVTYAGVINGAGAVTKVGTGTITLTGNNLFSGGLTIGAGTVSIANNTGLGALTSGVTFSGNSSIAFVTNATTLSAGRAVTINPGVTATFFAGTQTGAIASYITGAGTLSKAGTNSLTITNAGGSPNDYSGGTIISNGTLVVGANGAVLGTGVVTFSATAGNLDLSGKNLTIASLASSAANAGTVTNSSATAASLTLNGNVSTSYAGVISDGSLAKVGVNINLQGNTTVTLAGTNTFGNGLTLSSGIVSVNATGNLGTTSGGVVTLSGGTLQLYGTTFNSTALNRTFNLAAGGGTISLASGVTAIIASPFVGSTALTITGSGGILTLSGNNAAFSGGVNINNAIVRVGSSNALGTGTVTFSAAGATLGLTGQALTVGGITSSGGLGTITNSVATAASLTLNGSGSFAYSGLISDGTGSVSLAIAPSTGSSSLTLSGANAYTGGTTISSGARLFATNVSGSAVGSGATTVQTGGLLAGNGSVADVLFNGGRFDQSGFSPTATSLAINGNLTLSGGLLNFRLDNLGSDALSVSGNVVITSTTQVGISTFANPLTAANYTIIYASNSGVIANLSTQLTFSAAAITNLGNAHLTGSFVQSGGVQLDLVTTVTSIAWTGAGGGSAPSGTWDFATNNWIVNGVTPTTYLDTDMVVFNDNAGTGTATVTLSSNVSPSSITVSNSTALNYIIDSNGFSILTGSLVKDGNGTLTMTGNNAFTGGVFVNAGTVSVAALNNGGANGPLGAGSSLSAILLGSSTASGTLAYTGTSETSDRTFTLGTAGGSVYVASGNLTLSGTLSGGALRVNGPGVLNLTAANNYSGTTTISTGATLNLAGSGSIASAAIIVRGNLNLSSSAALTGNSNNPTVTLSNSGAIVTLSNSQGMVLLDNGTGGTVNLANSNVLTLNTGSSFGGVIGGSGGVTVAGNTTLAGVNTYTGLTSVSSGATLTLAGTGAIASSNISVGGTMLVASGASLTGNSNNPTVTVAGGVLTLSNSQGLVLAGATGAVSLANSNTLTLNTGSSFGGAIGGSGGVTVAGNTTLAGVNTYTGLTSVSSGATLTLAGTGAIASSNISVGGTMLVASGASLTGNSNNPTVTVAGGVLTLSNSQGLVLAGTTGTVNLANSNTLTLNTGSSFGGVIGGSSGAVTIAGNSTLSGVNTYTGLTSVNSGATLTLAGSGQIASTFITIGGTMVVASGATLSGNAGLPVTTVAGGILTLNNNQGITLHDAGAGGTVNLSNNNTMTMYGGSSFGGVIGGNGSVAISLGTTTLSGANTYTGGTSVNGGAGLRVTAAGSLAAGSNLTIFSTGQATFDNSNQSLGAVNTNGSVTFSAASGTISLSSLAGSGTSSFNSNAFIQSITSSTASISGNLTSSTGVSGGNVTVLGTASISAVSGASTAVTLAGATGAFGTLNGSGAITLSGTNLSINNGGAFNGSLKNGVSAGKLTVAGGTLDLTGATNNLTGGITIVTGATLTANALASLGSNTLSFTGGVLHVTGNINDSAAIVNINGSGGTFNIDSGKTLTLTGANITGNISQAGAGTLYIIGAYSGTTTVQDNGTLQANPSSTGNVILNPGATLDFTSTGNYAGNVTLSGTKPSGATIENTSGGLVGLTGTIDSGNANLTFSGNAGSSFNLTGSIIGDPTFSIDTTISSAQAYTGPTTISGNATVTSAVSINALPSTTILNLGETAGNTTGSYNLNGNIQTLSGIVAWGSGANNSITSSTGNASLYVNIASGVDSYSGKLGGSLSLFKEGAGTLALSGTSNNYTGATTIDAGTLQLGASSALPGTTTLSMNGTSTFDMQNFSQTVAALTSSSSTATVTGSGTLTVSHSSAFTSTYAGSVQGAMSLAFNGVANSAEVLSGNANNYSGTTTINSGALLVNGSITGAGGTVTVNSGGTLGGSGSIARAVSVAGTGSTGGTIAPGSAAQTVGTLTVNGALDISGRYLWDLGARSTNPATIVQTGAPGASFDRLMGVSSLTLNSGSLLELSFLNSTQPVSDPFWTTNHQWDIINGSFTTPLSGFGSLAGGSGVWDSGLNRLNFTGLGYFDVLYGANAVQLDWTAVPEPGSLLLATLASMGLGGYGWRKRKSKKALAADNAARV